MCKVNFKRKNQKFCFLYFKDISTILQFAKAGKPYKACKTMVALDSSGLPLFIPKNIRSDILKDNKLFVIVLTIFGVHRVIAWWPEVSLSTITDPFNGLSKVLDFGLITTAYNSLNVIAGHGRNFEFKLRPSRLLLLRSASPSGSDSITRMVQDGVALLANPAYLYKISTWLYLNKSYIVLISLYWTLVLSAISLLWYVPKHKCLGRISIIKTVSGKSRVIAITNYWIQVALKPLHDEMLSYLKGIPTDGTFDQLKPVKALFKDGNSYSSIDLSAATDRLPLDFQAQVLSCFIGERRSSLWKDLMSFTLTTGNLNLGEINYSVGQPMGAYSSWASLALSHHIIIQMSKPGTVKYAILGDDVVMLDELTEQYMKFMSTLGCEISHSKSIFNSRFCEFAKRLFNMNTSWGSELSIIGPKLIIGSIYNPVYRVNIALELLRKQQRSEFEVRKLIQSLATQRVAYFELGYWAMYGFGGCVRLDLSTVPFGRDQFLSEAPPNPVSLFGEAEEDEFSMWIEYPLYITYYRLIIKRHLDIIREALLHSLQITLFPKGKKTISPDGRIERKKKREKVSISGQLNHFIWGLSPGPLVLFFSNMRVIWSSLTTLFLVWLKEPEGFELPQLQELLHPKLLSSTVEDIDQVKADITMIKKIRKTLKLVLDLRKQGKYLTREPLSVRDESFSDLLFNKDGKD